MSWFRDRRRRVAPDEGPDQRRRFTGLAMDLLLLIPLVMIFSAESFLTGSPTQAVAELLLCAALTGLLIALLNLPRPLPYARLTSLAALLLLLFEMRISAGHQLACLWFLCLPLFAVSFFGQREGLLWSGACGGILTVFLATSVGPTYPEGLAPRFLVSYALVTVLAVALESSRERFARRLDAEKATLANALEEVRTLRGLLPFCPSCKKVRDDDGYWRQIEQYLLERSETTFSHGLCPKCFASLFPELQSGDNVSQASDEALRG